MTIPDKPKRKVADKYPYLNEDGELLFYAVRYEPKGFGYLNPAGKTAKQRNSKPDEADGYLYQLPQLLKAIQSGADVWWCAGEKDANNVQEQLTGRAVATTMHGGEKSKLVHGEAGWLAAHRGIVYIVGDLDLPGYKHMIARYEALQAEGFETSRIQLRLPLMTKPKSDVSDHLEAKRSLADLRTIKVDKLRDKIADLDDKAQQDKTDRKAQSLGQERLAKFEEALRKHGRSKGSGEDWSCPSPDHEDERPSFGVTIGDKGSNLVLFCQVCTPDEPDQKRKWISEVLEELGLSWSDIDDVQESLLDGIPQSDTEAADILFSRHGDVMRYVDAGQRASYWIVWDGLRWRRDVDGQAQRWVTEITAEFMPKALEHRKRAFASGVGIQPANAAVSAVRSYQNAARIDAVLRRLQTIQPGMTILVEALDADRERLGVANGTLRLTDAGIKLEDARSEALLTMNTDVDFKPGTVSDIWEDFLDTFLPGEELDEFVGRLMGYCLLGGNPDGWLIAMHGPTKSGKSTFLNALDAALGDYAAPFELTALLSARETGPREDIADIVDVRVAYTSEVSSRLQLHSDQIKRMTGADKMSFSRKNQRQERKHPMFTTLVACNEIPSVSGADVALQQRLMVVPFLNQVEARSRAGEGLRTVACRQAILAWICDGYNRYCARGIGIETWPTEVASATMEARDALDNVDLFLAEMCDVGPGCKVPVADINNAWRIWCDRNGLAGRDALPGHMFPRALNGKEYKMAKVWYKPLNASVNCRIGIELRGNAAVKGGA